MEEKSPKHQDSAPGAGVLGCGCWWLGAREAAALPAGPVPCATGREGTLGAGLVSSPGESKPGRSPTTRPMSLDTGPASLGSTTPVWAGMGQVQSICFLLPRDTFIVTLGNAITSILAGFAIFSVLGYMSQELGVPVNQVAKAGEAEEEPSSLTLCLGQPGLGRGGAGQLLHFHLHLPWHLQLPEQRPGMGNSFSACISLLGCLPGEAAGSQCPAMPGVLGWFLTNPFHPAALCLP